VQRFKREGIALSDSTIGGWISATADLLEPLYDALAEEARSSGYVQADETPIQVQDPQKKGKTHRGYYWVYRAPLPQLVVMDYREGRSRDGPAAWLDGFEGALQTDGYAAYDAFEHHLAITTYGCWAHARRYFFEAKDSSPDEAAVALAEIAKLYEIERGLRDEHATAEERRAARQEHAVPVLDGMKAWLESQQALPKSPLGKAVGYALKSWKKLVRYAGDGRIEIDNNLVENAIRPIALGRKNYLFAGSHAAARRAAVIYSLLATCKAHDVNPQVWLADVLARIPTHQARHVAELLPHRWDGKR
jgi:transposase